MIFVNNNKVKFGLLGLIAGGLVVWIFMSNNLVDSSRLMGPQSNFIMSSSTIDAHFIEQMIPHHDGAIAMSKLALTKATHLEIKTLAKNIIESQSKEITDMQSWYKDWFGQDVSKQNTFGMMGGGMMSGGGMHMGGQEDMTALENAKDFDKAFIEEMIPHHQLAIMMANMLQSGTNRSEMQQLAKNIISSQTNEIQQMQGWYTNWYK